MEEELAGRNGAFERAVLLRTHVLVLVDVARLAVMVL
jgi:hypothetical protein